MTSKKHFPFEILSYMYQAPGTTGTMFIVASAFHNHRKPLSGWEQGLDKGSEGGWDGGMGGGDGGRGGGGQLMLFGGSSLFWFPGMLEGQDGGTTLVSGGHYSAAS